MSMDSKCKSDRVLFQGHQQRKEVILLHTVCTYDIIIMRRFTYNRTTLIQRYDDAIKAKCKCNSTISIEHYENVILT